jgi:U4/U6 small nuclear ribonucleoprotein PRP31
MSAYENRGKNLDENELKLLNQACDLLLCLDSAKQTITKFVSSQLSIFAPNVTTIIDSHTAAQIMGFAGGLSGLSKTPSSNIPSLGAKQQRQTGIGFSNIGVRQQGFLYNSEIIQSVPMDQRVQAMRMVAGKLVLAARVDLVHSSTDGAQGKKWRNEIQERLDKLLEPPENKATKALPIPEDKPSKKRGGKRIRKFKEQFKQTELQKAQNRISFGENGHADDSIYYDDDEEGDTIGFQPSVSLNDLSTGGSVRNINIDSKVKARMSKAMQQRVQKVGGLTSSIASVIPASGLSSTFVAPVQAVQLGQQSSLNPSVNGDKWFNSGTFTSIKKDHTGIQLGKRKINLPAPEPKKRSK